MVSLYRSRPITSQRPQHPTDRRGAAVSDVDSNTGSQLRNGGDQDFGCYLQCQLWRRRGKTEPAGGARQPALRRQHDAETISLSPGCDARRAAAMQCAICRTRLRPSRRHRPAHWSRAGDKPGENALTFGLRDARATVALSKFAFSWDGQAHLGRVVHSIASLPGWASRRRAAVSAD